jgi:hypothetical protein
MIGAKPDPYFKHTLSSKYAPDAGKQIRENDKQMEETTRRYHTETWQRLIARWLERQAKDKIEP